MVLHNLEFLDTDLSTMAVNSKANRYNFLVAFFVTLGSFTYGYNSSVTAGVIGLPSFFAYLDITPSTTQGDSIIGGKFPLLRKVTPHRPSK